MAGPSAEGRKCRLCGKTRERDDYSRKQWRRAPGTSVCQVCTESAQAPTGTGAGAGRQSRKRPGGPPTALSWEPRPLCEVPGFGGLLFASDWPPTRKGRPPGAQSAIFNPLLACALGPIEGHCTADQVAAAVRWWALALPSWPRWLAALRAAGVGGMRPALLRQAKGDPTPLIHKARGHGTVPHFRGKAQNAALELDPAVAVEVYACVTCLWEAAGVAAGRHRGDEQQEAVEREDVASSGPPEADPSLERPFEQLALEDQNGSASASRTPSQASHGCEGAPEMGQSQGKCAPEGGRRDVAPALTPAQ